MKPVVVVLTADLFFRAKIEAVAEAAGTAVECVGSGEGLEERLEGAGRVLVDLAHGGADPAATIRALKARAAPPEVIAFGPHRDADAFRAAREAGADRVLARSAFVERLPELLGGSPPGQAGE